MGKSTTVLSMAIFNSYVSLPEGNLCAINGNTCCIYMYIYTYANQLCAINGEEIYVEIEDVLSTPLPESQGFLKLGCDWL